MRVVVVGQGGREHALAQTISKSPALTSLWVLPGNPGMEKEGLACVPAGDVQTIVTFCQTMKVDLVVIGPEAFILSGLKQKLKESSIACVAPDLEGANLEASKKYCKNVLVGAGIPTASFEVATSLEQAQQLLEQHDFATPLVLKADGLAQGKGVHVVPSLEEARISLEHLTNQFGFPILVEQCLRGQELSAFALCDGEDFVLLGTACDYKRISSDYFSANTGGMGAFSPCTFVNEEDERAIESIFRKTLRYLKDQGVPYEGFLFAGLMKTAEGLFVLEFNVRMGDPETQVLLPRIKEDFLSLLWKASQKKLKDAKVTLDSRYALHVVMTSEGYPQASMRLGVPIQQVENLQPGIPVFYSGVKLQNSLLVNGGGRVLGVTAMGKSLSEARTLAYQELQKFSFQGHYYRKDIGL